MMGLRAQHGVWTWVVLGLGVLPTAGCRRRDPPEVLALRQSMTVETAQLGVDLDRIEARLQEDSMRLRLFSDLADRHRRVSALACANAERHANSMRWFSERFQRRTATRRLAQADSADDSAGARRTR